MSRFFGPCSNGGLVELEEYIYEAIISLDHCGDWVINVCASGNDNAITTIIGQQIRIYALRLK